MPHKPSLLADRLRAQKGTPAAPTPVPAPGPEAAEPMATSMEERVAYLETTVGEMQTQLDQLTAPPPGGAFNAAAEKAMNSVKPQMAVA